jgi:hypothetical protein
MNQAYDATRERDADFCARLEKTGFLLDFGDDDSGLSIEVPASRVWLLRRRRRLGPGGEQ